jgi:hypothetical protein
MTESFSSCCDSLIHFVAMSTSRKFAHDDIVKVIKTGETGIVKSFHQDENGSVYGDSLGEARPRRPLCLKTSLNS